MGTRRGETRRGPFSPKMRIWSGESPGRRHRCPITIRQRPGSASSSRHRGQGQCPSRPRRTGRNRSDLAGLLDGEPLLGVEVVDPVVTVPEVPVRPVHNASVPMPQQEPPRDVMATRCPPPGRRTDYPADQSLAAIRSKACRSSRCPRVGLVTETSKVSSSAMTSSTMVETVGIESSANLASLRHLVGGHLENFHRALR